MPVKKKRIWLPVKKKSASKVPDALKSQVKAEADELIEKVLKPKFIKPPPEDNDFNYLVDIYSKWYRNYFYFCSKYNCPGPNAISPSFESKFARLEYMENGSFALSYMRHNDKWLEIASDLSLKEALDTIESGGSFFP